MATTSRCAAGARAEPGSIHQIGVCDLARITERAENLVGHHLRALRDAGLAASRRDGKIVFYSLTTTGRRFLDTVLEIEACAR